MKISPSVLAADLTDLKSILEQMDPDTIDLIHLDIMDGHFVPQLSYGETYAGHITKHTSIQLDVHLMVTKPHVEVPKYFDLKPHNITFHLETTHFPIRLARSIREQGILAGVALNPGTSIDLVDPVLDEVDLILIMSVEPGFYGQSFIESTYDRIKALKEKIGDRKIIIEVDGGVHSKNIQKLASYGVELVVAGSACFKGADVNTNTRNLKKAAQNL